MKHEIYTWLEDINTAIIQIYEFLPANIKYSDFEGDIKTQKAIERNIEIIDIVTRITRRGFKIAEISVPDFHTHFTLLRNAERVYPWILHQNLKPLPFQVQTKPSLNLH